MVTHGVGSCMGGKGNIHKLRTFRRFVFTVRKSKLRTQIPVFGGFRFRDGFRGIGKLLTALQRWLDLVKTRSSVVGLRMLLLLVQKLVTVVQLQLLLSLRDLKAIVILDF